MGRMRRIISDALSGCSVAQSAWECERRRRGLAPIRLPIFDESKHALQAASYSDLAPSRKGHGKASGSYFTLGIWTALPILNAPLSKLRTAAGHVEDGVGRGCGFAWGLNTGTLSLNETGRGCSSGSFQMRRDGVMVWKGHKASEI